MKPFAHVARAGFLVAALCFCAFSANAPITSNGYCKGIRLAGRVKIVQAHEDFRVRVVSSHEDLRVRRMEQAGLSDTFEVGEWCFVDHHPDFTIRIVDAHPDFTIRYVNSHPGVR